MNEPNGGAQSPSAPTLDGAVRQARLEFAFGNHPMSLSVSVMLGALTVWVLAGFGTASILYLWFALLASVNAMRLWQYRRYRRERGTGADLNRWERFLLGGCLASGTIWGSSALLFLPTAAHEQFFLAFVLAGVSAGAVSSLSVTLRPALAFVIPCVLPLAVRFMLQGDSMHLVMGIMTLLYIGFTISVARSGDAQLTQMVKSQIDALVSNTRLQTSEQHRHVTGERLRIATEAGLIGVWEWDLKTGAVEWDKQIFDIYRLANVPGGNLYEVWRQRVHPGDIERVEAQLNAAVAGTAEYNTEFRIVWPDGQERIIKGSGTVVRDEQGQPISLTGINLDITELRRVERMKSEFVSIVSHELRTPLTSIRGSLGLVANDAAGPVPEKVKQILALADRNAQRLSVLIDDLLDIERLEAGRLKFDLQRQPLAPLLRQAVSANVHYAARRQVELRLLAPVPEVSVDVDSVRLLQVMSNLLSNAVKFSPVGEQVDISATASPEWVRVEVRDRGPGIAQHFQSKVFGKFSQGDSSDVRAAGGTGLGLAISKAIIEQLHGAIGFDTAIGAGTTFFFELPLRSAASGTVQHTTDIASA